MVQSTPTAGPGDQEGDVSSEIPDGITIETIYLVEVPYTPEAAARRPAVRAEHLTRIGLLIDEGRVVEAGGCGDMSKAVLLVRAAAEREALRLIEEDVYTRAGVWTSPRATPYGRVVPVHR